MQNTSRTFTRPREKRENAPVTSAIHQAAQILVRIGSGKPLKNDIAMASIIGRQLERRK